jgi:hypothetical protein
MQAEIVRFVPSNLKLIETIMQLAEIRAEKDRMSEI